jgi:Holliday junction resolvase RusA-like endonuclease
MIHLNIQAKPLSVNKAWRGGARYRTNDYKDFEKEVMYQLPKIIIKGDVEMFYKFFIKTYNRTDVSNLIKCVEDIIVKAGLIEDDRKVIKLTAEKYKSDKESINIIIKEYKIK